MAEIINLNDRRKQRARKQKSLEAEANRAKFGRTKAVRSLSEREQASEVKRLDGVRRTTSFDESSDDGDPPR